MRERVHTLSDTVYCYPGTDVLRNKLDIRDSKVLHDAERDITARRLLQLYDSPIRGSFDYSHLKSIHRFIFQDIYEWAGKERKVDIAKSNMFCNVLFLSEQAERIFYELRKDGYLRNLSLDQFSEKCTYYFGEINALHPFREGNGRTQREFFRELALEAGHELDFSEISEEEMVEASIDSFMLQYDKLLDIIRKSLIK